MILGRIARIAKMRPIATHVARVYVCVLRPAKTAEPIEVAFEGAVGPKNHVLERVKVSPNFCT